MLFFVFFLSSMERDSCLHNAVCKAGQLVRYRECLGVWRQQLFTLGFACVLFFFFGFFWF